jgi:hypothetical protein
VAVVPSTHTFTDGIATSTEANAYLRDPINFQAAPPMAQLRQNAAQSFTTGVYTALTFELEDLDTNVAGTPQHDLVTNNSRFTAVYSGWYLCSGGIGWVANATGRRGSSWRVNGVSLTFDTIIPTTAALSAAYPVRTMFAFLNVGDYVELFGYQDSGGALNTNSSTNGSHMSVLRVST